MRLKLARPNPALTAIVLEGLFSRLSFGLITFALPLYARHLGLSFTKIGLLASLNTAVALALKPLMGWVADRIGTKRAFMFAIGIRSAISLALGFAALPWQLFAIRSAHGLSMSLRDPSANALIAENGGKKSVASAFAWYQTSKSLAGSLSKAAAGVLLAVTAANFSIVFFIAFLLSIIPIVLVWRNVKDAPPEHSLTTDEPGAVPPSEREPAAPTRKRKGLLPYIGLGFLISSTAEMLGGLFPIIATEYAHLSTAQTGIIYGLSTTCTIFAGPIFGWLSDHVSRKLVLMVRSFSNVVSSVLYFSTGFAPIAMARCTDDLGKAAFRPAWGALMAELSDTDRKSRARTMSLLGMGDDAGEIVAPIVAGFLLSTWGLPVVLGTRVGLAIVTELWALFAAPTPNASSPEGGCPSEAASVTPEAVESRTTASLVV